MVDLDTVPCRISASGLGPLRSQILVCAAEAVLGLGERGRVKGTSKCQRVGRSRGGGGPVLIKMCGNFWAVFLISLTSTV